ncbi:MAG TPA: 5-oxoprolinase subunit PxpB [Candidatus Marinimicrobia bacterium]|nr:5-oxoprolinase subunit PxpB [Candidatus Neomarinimicrobiota bacterium]
MTISSDFNITPASDRTLLIQFGEENSPDAQKAVFRFSHYLMDHSLEGIANFHPGYASILVSVDIDNTSVQSIQKDLQQAWYDSGNIELPESKLIEILVLYGGEYGLDLIHVAEHNGISESKVIELHSCGEYYVSFIGFTPGFPYISGLNPKLETPRLNTPRKRVPAGSVAIGGSQTGIYPLESPGGWNLIGQTPIQIFDINHPENALINMRDKIKFIPIDEEEFERLKQS